MAARTVVARGRVGRRVGEWQRRVGPGEGDSPQVRVPLGRASGPGVRRVGPSSRPRWVRVAPVSAQQSAHSAPNRPDSPHFCATRPTFLPDSDTLLSDSGTSLHLLAFLDVIEAYATSGTRAGSPVASYALDHVHDVYSQCVARRGTPQQAKSEARGGPIQV